MFELRVHQHGQSAGGDRVEERVLADKCWTGRSIGANSTIVSGRVGGYCFVAAGAVVCEDVASYALMAGVPAKRIGWMSRVGARLRPTSMLICPVDGSRYVKTRDGDLELLRLARAPRGGRGSRRAARCLSSRRSILQEQEVPRCPLRQALR